MSRFHHIGKIMQEEALTYDHDFADSTLTVSGILVLGKSQKVRHRSSSCEYVKTDNKKKEASKYYRSNSQNRENISSLKELADNHEEAKIDRHFSGGYMVDSSYYQIF